MGKVYWNKKEIPIPEGLHINKNDGRVYSLEAEPGGTTRRLVFGYATSMTTMHVNDNFKLIYPEQWKRYYGEDDIRPYMPHAGMYALCLGASKQSGLYGIVQDRFGPKHGNAIMDYAMFSLLSRLDVTQMFPERMAEEILFSDTVYSDSWYSDLFKNGISKNEIHAFRNEWLRQCKEKGVNKAWISIDGSNNDCQVENSDLSDQGKAKSGKNVNVVSYIYAVDSSTGIPLTYCVNDGSVVDSKAFQLICMLLHDSGIEIEGVIIDRGFCAKEVIKMIRKCGYRYVLMLKANTTAHTEMMDEHASDIRWKVEYCVGDNGLFGITEKKKIFSNCNEEAYVSLLFDGVNGSQRSVALIEKIRKAAREAQKKLDNGEETKIAKELSKYLSIDRKTQQVKYNYDTWQKSVDEKGYHSLASSEEHGAEWANGIYHLRDASETQFMIMKSMEGFDVIRAHSDPSIESKFAVCFIASILRQEIMNACKEFGYDTNRIMREIDRIQLLLKSDGKYYPVRNYTQRQKEILGMFGVNAESFDAIAYDVSYRETNSIKSQERTIPTVPVSGSKKRGRPAKQKEVNSAPKKKGRPKGSLNKKTLERLEKEKNNPQTEKRGKGRPKGSLNKKTIERMKQDMVEQIVEKRKPGRPKGSLNKKTIEKMDKLKKIK